MNCSNIFPIPQNKKIDMHKQNVVTIVFSFSFSWDGDYGMVQNIWYGRAGEGYIDELLEV